MDRDRTAFSVWKLAATAGLVAASAGCGGDGMPPLYHVTGRVTLDGKPIPDATVTFQPMVESPGQFARPSICLSAPDGTIEPWTMQEGDGLPAGRYRVGVAARRHVGGPPQTASTTPEEYARMKFEWAVPKRYLDAKTSSIEVEVTPDGMVPEEITLSSR